MLAIVCERGGLRLLERSSSLCCLIIQLVVKKVLKQTDVAECVQRVTRLRFARVKEQTYASLTRNLLASHTLICNCETRHASLTTCHVLNLVFCYENTS